MLTPCSIFRPLLAAGIILVGLLASLLHVTPAAAADTAQAVRLVQLPDGRLEVQRGPQFQAVAGTAVLAEEEDVQLRTSGRLEESLDSATGLINDALRRDQWNLDEVQAEVAWARATGEGQVIAVVDSGVDGGHPDLRDRLVAGFSAIGADERVDGHGHGTHVAGTAAASMGDGYGVAGLAPQAAIMPIQVTDPQGLAYASDVAEGLIWAVDNGATVANLSLAGTRESLVLNGAIDHAVASGVVVVVAAGNEYARGNPVTYPASHPDVIAVAAMRDANTRSAFSSAGDWVDLAAPGSSIISTRPDSTFGYASGTSMAAPLVAGAAALVRSAAPDLSTEDVRALLHDGARDLGAAGWDEEFGHGALDLLTVLDQITDAPPVNEELDEAPLQAPQLTRVEGLYAGEGFSRRP